ncbi:hypothetical protein D3C72_1193070 [compost metagenome]
MLFSHGAAARNRWRAHRFGHALAEQGDADHAYVQRAACAAGVRRVAFRKVEGRNLGLAFAPAGDGPVLPGVEDVAVIRCARCHLAVERIDAIDADDRQNAAAGTVGDINGIAGARAARHPVFALVLVQPQGLARRAVHQLDIGQPAARRGWTRLGGGHACCQQARGEQGREKWRPTNPARMGRARRGGGRHGACSDRL